MNVTRGELYLALFPVWTFFIALTARALPEGDWLDVVLLLMAIGIALHTGLQAFRNRTKPTDTGSGT